MRLGLRHKLILILAFAAIVPLVVAMLQSLRTFERWAATNYQEELSEQSRFFRAFVEQRRVSVLQDLVRFASDPAVSTSLASKSSSRLLNLAISHSLEMRADSFYVVSDDESLLFDAVQTRWGSIDPAYDFYAALGLSLQSSAGLLIDAEYGFGIVATTTVRNQRGGVAGAVVAFVPFSDVWMTNLKDITEFDFTVLAKDRRNVSSTLPANQDKLPQPTIKRRFEPLHSIELANGLHAALEQPLTDIAGDEIGSILISRSVSGLMAVLTRVMYEVTLVAAIALLAALLIARFFSRRITAPLTDLVLATERIANQDYDAKFETSSGDEIGQLGKSFNVMVQRLRESTRRMEVAAHELERRVEERTAELRSTQLELIRKERLATVGQLTATVSHELRNPLGAVRSAADAIKRLAGGREPQLDRALALLERSQIRCDNVIVDLLDFSRVQELNRSAASIDDWLGRFLDDYEFPPGIMLHRDLQAGVEIAIDLDRLERAVRNVVDNACQAMQGNGDRADDPFGQQLVVASRATDMRLELSFKDSGPGITAEDQTSIFEPLHSTKSFGLGLGLPMVKQILEQHGGGVDINLDLAHGTEFILWIPRGKPV